jgi:predicted transcriptional regulator
MVNFIQTIFMSTDNIKQKIHQLIDELDDETALQMLYEDAVEYKTAATEDDDLTEEQWAEIDKGLKQIENGETYTSAEVLQHLKEWRNTK